MSLEEEGTAVVCGKSGIRPPRTGKIARVCDDCRGDFIGLPATKYCADCRYKTSNRKAAIKRTWIVTEERDKIIRERYDPHVKGRVREIGKMIGWPPHAVRKRARDLGGLLATRPALWTPKEEAFVEKHAGNRTPAWIAAALTRRGQRRTVSSVIGKIKDLSLSRAIKHGYSLLEVAACFGVHGSTASKWLEKGMLKATRGDRSFGPNTVWQIRESDVLDFIFEHPGAFQLRYVDQTWFLDLMRHNLHRQDPALVGPRKEPKRAARNDEDDEWLRA